MYAYFSMYVYRFTAGGNIATSLTLLALILSGYFLHQSMVADGSSENEANVLSYKDFSPKGIPVSLGVMAFCK
jgi:hypothetical protein